MSRLKVYGWNAGKLSDAYSFEELEQMRQAVITDSRSQNPTHRDGSSIYIYTKSARRKLDALAWAVTYKLQEQRRVKTPFDPIGTSSLPAGSGVVGRLNER